MEHPETFVLDPTTPVVHFSLLYISIVTRGHADSIAREVVQKAFDVCFKQSFCSVEITDEEVKLITL